MGCDQCAAPGYEWHSDRRTLLYSIRLNQKMKIVLDKAHFLRSVLDLISNTAERHHFRSLTLTLPSCVHIQGLILFYPN